MAPRIRRRSSPRQKRTGRGGRLPPRLLRDPSPSENDTFLIRDTTRVYVVRPRDTPYHSSGSRPIPASDRSSGPSVTNPALVDALVELDALAALTQSHRAK